MKKYPSYYVTCMKFSDFSPLDKSIADVPVQLNLKLAKEIAESILSRIYHRYELGGAGEAFWHTTQNMASDTWDIVKYKLAKKAVAGNQEFFMLFTGSSVTAGHDHYYNQSYPLIVQKRMTSLMSALGIQLVVRNIAQGANPCNPYHLCYEAMGGPNPDWVGWEQSYNCGHDEGSFEMAARWAGWSKNRGIAVSYDLNQMKLI